MNTRPIGERAARAEGIDTEIWEMRMRDVCCGNYLSSGECCAAENGCAFVRQEPAEPEPIGPNPDADYSTYCEVTPDGGLVIFAEVCSRCGKRRSLKQRPAEPPAPSDREGK